MTTYLLYDTYQPRCSGLGFTIIHHIMPRSRPARSEHWAASSLLGRARFSVSEYEYMTFFCYMRTSLVNIPNSTLDCTMFQRDLAYEIAVELSCLEATYAFPTMRRSKTVHSHKIAPIPKPPERLKVSRGHFLNRNPATYDVKNPYC